MHLVHSIQIITYLSFPTTHISGFWLWSRTDHRFLYTCISIISIYQSYIYCIYFVFVNNKFIETLPWSLFREPVPSSWKFSDWKPMIFYSQTINNSWVIVVNPRMVIPHLKNVFWCPMKSCTKLTGDLGYISQLTYLNQWNKHEINQVGYLSEKPVQTLIYRVLSGESNKTTKTTRLRSTVFIIFLCLEPRTKHSNSCLNYDIVLLIDLFMTKIWKTTVLCCTYM